MLQKKENIYAHIFVNGIEILEIKLILEKLNIIEKD
jgi:hypothetical protein